MFYAVTANNFFNSPLMDTAVFLNISKIIERESKTTTYKFALLRGVIDIIGENSPYITMQDGKAHFPLGLLIEKWLIYYYPFFEVDIPIPQINGGSRLAFQKELQVITHYYKNRGGLSVFYNDLRTGGFSKEIITPFLGLIKKLRDTITRMPMKHLGTSVNNQYYSIFSYQSQKARTTATLNLEWLITSFGSFSIPLAYFEAFRILGSFVSGTDSILFKWADFSVTASGNELTVARVLHEALKNPVTERDVLAAQRLYRSVLQQSGVVTCVWTGAALTRYDIDHVIPFSIWKNNDLWNLLPATPIVNNRKRNKIPSSLFLEQRKDHIIRYWEALKRFQEERFLAELRVALLGKQDIGNWQNQAFEQLKNTSDYLIQTRGYESWEL